MHTIPYLIAYFLLGAYSISIQILLIREFMVILFGNELSMGIIFSAWLLAIFLGALSGAKVVSRVRHPLSLFLVWQYLLMALPHLQIALTRNLRFFLHVSPGEYVPFFSLVFSVFVVVMPFAFVIGFIFPFAVSIFPSSGIKPAHGIGQVYLWESLGSMLGGGVLVFYLILNFTPYQIIAVLMVGVFINAGVLTCEIKIPLRRRVFFLLWMALFLALAGLSAVRFWTMMENKTLCQRWHSINPHIEMLVSTDSPYQNIVVGKLADQYSMYGNGQHLASFPDPYQSAMKAHFILSQHPQPDDILLIGGGFGGLLPEILKHPVKRVHCVELDAKLLETARDYLSPEDNNALNDSRVKVFVSDGRFYVKTCSVPYDLIIINLPDPSTALLNRYYTVDFYKEIRRILKPGGLTVTDASSAENYIGPEIGHHTGSIYHALATVFPSVLVTPGESNYFFASRSSHVAIPDSTVLAERYKSRTIDTPYFSEYSFRFLLPPERVAFINRALRDFPVPYLNTDTRPISYFYNLVLWDIFSGGKQRTFFDVLGGLSWRCFFLPLGILLIIRLLYLSLKPYRSASETRFNSLYAVFSTGFAGMGLEIILIFSYQNMYGYLYQKIGLIVALFMAGLAVGAYGMNRLMDRFPKAGQTVLLGIEMAIAVFSMTLPCLLIAIFGVSGTGTSFAGEGFLMALVLVSGVLTGTEFPLVGKILIDEKITLGRAAGLVDAGDHLGASLGAAFTGTVLVPLLGIHLSSLFIATLNFISCIFIFCSLLRRRCCVGGGEVY
ncbi:MAG: hypothetical protein JXD19_04680 [Deltaproteobacteria bacterium]|nr:hypothetical protein [Deltaproteobacteria bacterium]